VSKRTRYLLGIGVIAALVMGWQVAAFAVHTEGVFELEGNAVDDAAVAGDDWANVFAGTDSADDTSFTAEPNPQASFFTGGGSKDPQDLPAWKWKDDVGGLPDKSNIRDSYAASYTDATSGDELLYFGADRFDGSGDAAIAFWFLQDEAAQTPANASSGTFTGVHTDGDVLVISNFSNGGAVSTITVYKWDPSCTKASGPNPGNGDCGAANLRVVTTSDTADCSAVAAGDDACAIVNNAGDAPNTAPWPFTDKSGSTTFLPGELFEGGINLTALDLGGECFATAIAETRTSTSPTSVLKDFTIGPFGDCEAGMTTQASKLNNATPPAPVAAGTVTPGTPVFDIATITGTGTTPPIDPTGTVDFFLCGPGKANPVTADGCPATATPDTAVGTDKPVSGGSNTTDGISTATSDNVNTAGSPLAPGKYCFRAEYSGDTNYDPNSETNATTECFTVSQPPTITTAQKWLPQDTATVTPAGTAGTVVFSLYNNGTCTAPAATTFTDTAADANGVFETNNTTYRTAGTEISWSATFTPSGNEDPSTTTRCEKSVLTIDNSASAFPPPTP
jgi:hypothetical protein